MRKAPLRRRGKRGGLLGARARLHQGLEVPESAFEAVEGRLLPGDEGLLVLNDLLELLERQRAPARNCRCEAGEGSRKGLHPSNRTQTLRVPLIRGRTVPRG